MLLLVGLGNPGPRYAGNRHNVGFMALDRIQDRRRFPGWRARRNAETTEASLADDKVLLLKPQTYMNESGQAVGEAMRFYKLTPSDVVVIYDELDLPPGKFRMKAGGGHGGHNGLRSINAHIGEGYRRLRIGIGHPGHKDAVVPYVLKDFAKADLDWLDPLLDAIADHADLLVAGKDSSFANKVHLATGDSGDAKTEKKKPASSAKEPDQDGARPSPAPGPADKAESGPFAALGKLIGRTPGRD
ncbi:aminoacyl-tRNA hydrolase [Amorphus orientalis]|uniref:Peptidyl-tRNA hydrolase n=1 Tax=Amorphus orientalis TaxID=649198 RepID=A0AAE4ATW6_9HYPH|nr:aminoacyl-tRNA hydrolase [Amorphus orientalis]MDQ0316665.1 PTH1 family peptidyl-tRNA hydrolase [Amorphus orientalis]